MKRNNSSGMPLPARRVSSEQQRITPQALESEQSTLGAMMIDGKIIPELAQLVEATDFYREIHRKIFGSIVALHDQAEPVDFITVVEEMRRRGELDDVGGAAYVQALIEACPSAANFEAYARAVRDKADSRRLIEISDTLSSRCYYLSGEDNENVRMAAEAAIAQLQRVIEKNGAGSTPDTVTGVELAKLQLPEPRWAVPGLLPEGLCIMGGKMKMGKSWLALAMGIAVASGGRVLGEIKVEEGDVLYLALEDNWRRLQDRQNKILRGDAAPARLHLQNEWPRADEGGLEKIDRWLGAHPSARLVVIDVLQKFRAARERGGDLYGEDYQAIGVLKRLADRHNVALMLIHHLSKRECDDPFEALTGTLGIPGAADALLALDRKRGREDAVLHITGRDVGDEKKALEWHGDICTWTMIGDADELGLSEEMKQETPLWLLIIEQLEADERERRAAPMRFSLKRIARVLGLRRDAVAVWMNRLNLDPNEDLERKQVVELIQLICRESSKLPSRERFLSRHSHKKAVGR